MRKRSSWYKNNKLLLGQNYEINSSEVVYIQQILWLWNQWSYGSFLSIFDIFCNTLYNSTLLVYFFQMLNKSHCIIIITVNDIMNIALFHQLICFHLNDKWRLFRSHCWGKIYVLLAIRRLFILSRRLRLRAWTILRFFLACEFSKYLLWRSSIRWPLLFTSLLKRRIADSIGSPSPTTILTLTPSSVVLGTSFHPNWM